MVGAYRIMTLQKKKGQLYVINDPTILLDKFVLPKDMCQALIDEIQNSIASVVSDGSFNPASPIGPVGTSTVILASSTEYLPRYWAKGRNWVTVQQHRSRPITVNWPAL